MLDFYCQFIEIKASLPEDLKSSFTRLYEQAKSEDVILSLFEEFSVEQVPVPAEVKDFLFVRGVKVFINGDTLNFFFSGYTSPDHYKDLLSDIRSSSIESVIFQALELFIEKEVAS